MLRRITTELHSARGAELRAPRTPSLLAKLLPIRNARSSRHQESFSYLNKPASVTGNPRPAVAARSSSADSPDPGTSGAPLTWQHGVGAVAVLAGLACALSTPQAAVYKDMLMESKLGKSGFVAAFSLIFLSELGDKTFFIAAILAMKVGKWISFLGSVSALSLMSFISVAIGHVFSKVPEALQSSLPLGEIAGTALLVVFGLRNLQEGMSSNGDDKEKSDEEYSGAESAVKKAEEEGLRRKNPLKSFAEVATVIFLAEWGDRSMFATIALGASQNPISVAAGASFGHAVATAIAVLGGAVASSYISEKTVNVTSGLIFIILAVANMVSMLQ